MTPVEIRQQLVEALCLDFIGPDPVRELGIPNEILPQAPARWYLTGFLVPLDADDEQRTEETSVDEMDEAGDAKGAGSRNGGAAASSLASVGLPSGDVRRAWYAITLVAWPARIATSRCHRVGCG